MIRLVAIMVAVVVVVLPTLATAVDVPVPKGWTAVDKTQTYTRSNVFEAINGAAELYLAHGLEELRIVPMKQGEVEASVYVYKHDTALNAFGIFQRQRPPDAKPLAAGARAAFASAASCMSLDGGWYVEARAIAGDLTEASCATLLGGISRALPGAKGLPSELSLLPVKGRVNGSVRYTRESFLGTRDLTRCLHATYEKGDTTYQAFVMLPREGSDVATTWTTLQARWKPAEHKGQAILTRSIPYQGTVVLTASKTHLRGIAGAKDLPTALELLPAP